MVYFSEKKAKEIFKGRLAELVNCSYPTGCLVTAKLTPFSNFSFHEFKNLLKKMEEIIKSNDGLFSGIEGHTYINSFFSEELYCQGYANKALLSAKQFFEETRKSVQWLDFKIGIAHGSVVLGNPLASHDNLVTGGKASLRIHYMLDDNDDDQLTNRVLVDDETVNRVNSDLHTFIQVAQVKKPLEVFQFFLYEI